MRILICIPVLLGGGTETQVLSVIRSIKDGGGRASVCCYYEYDDKVVTLFEQAGAEVILLRLDRSGGLGPFRIIELVRSVMQVILEIRPDVVHVQYLAPGLIPIIAARLAGARSLLSTIHIAGKSAYGWKAKAMLRTASLFCDAFICVSKGVEEFWFGSCQVYDPVEQKSGRKHFTIYNCVDIVSIRTAVEMSDRVQIIRAIGAEGRPVIGIVGRLAHQKGHSVLFEAMVEVVKAIPDVLLLIIGDGSDRTMLEKKALELGIHHHIFWTGYVPLPKVYEYYAVMDVLAMPSLYEGFGLSAAEAMAAGVPVVGTLVDGLSELIEDGVTGRLVRPGDNQSLAEALVFLLTNPDARERYSANAVERINGMFSMERFSNSMIELYKSYGV